MAGDALSTWADGTIWLFQSTPTNFMAGDQVGSRSSGGADSFNPRPPISWRATVSRGQPVRGRGVSIHARQFHSGRPSKSPVMAAAAALFQSTPANFTAGDARWSPARWAAALRFQSTPANFTAGDAGSGRPEGGAACFNPRPPISQRATRRKSSKGSGIQRVSIHARQFHSGRPSRAYSRVLPVIVSIHARQFHSGRPVAAKTAVVSSVFQSTPANFTAGDSALILTAAILFLSFNPRPPISQRATLECATVCSIMWAFQSTPANFTAGDTGSHVSPCVHTPSFNPRPPISQRATAELFARADDLGVSIHARQFHSGRPLPAPGGAAGRHVSIHARQFHSGRRPRPARPPRRRACFNPRPPISQRATQAPRPRRASPRGFNPRPPISQRATQQTTHSHATPLWVSIHARQFHSGRRAGPRPSRPVHGVSIHARQFHSGRQSRRGASGVRLQFQSTPANFTAGDPQRPAPRQRWREVSIHARQFHSGRRSR